MWGTLGGGGGGTLGGGGGGGGTLGSMKISTSLYKRIWVLSYSVFLNLINKTLGINMGII